MKTLYTEKQLCSQIIQYLNYQGHYVWRENSGAIKTEYKGKTHMIRMAHRGTSDIIGMSKDGKFVAIEVKKPETKKSVTVYQQMFLDEVKQHGGISGVATSPEEALAILEANDLR